MKVLLTRPRPEAESFAAELDEHGIEAVVAPLFVIAPRVAESPNLSGVTALAFTSANGVRTFAAVSDERALPAYCVGDVTASVAREAGFRNVASAARDGEALVELIVARLAAGRDVVLHCSGEEIACDLAGALRGRGFEARRVILYSVVTTSSLPDDARRAIAGGEVDGAVFFSPRSASAFVSLVDDPETRGACAAIDAFCLSSAVSEAVSAIRWRAVHVAASPDRAALLRCIVARSAPAGRDLEIRNDD